MASGATIDDVHAAIIGSEEYRSRHENHPISRFSGIYVPASISYFTHRGRFRPLGLSIETVNICNNDCIICPYSAQTRQKRAMTMEMFKRVIRDYTEIGGGPVTLTPMVGEAFLDKLLVERLRLLRDAPSIAQVSVTTNASMVRLYSDAELQEIIDLFDRIKISVYGLDREEFQVMTRTDRYPEFLAGLCRLLRFTPPEKISLGARHLKKRSPEEIDRWLAEIADRSGVAKEGIKFAGTSTYMNWSFFDTATPLPFDASWTAVKTNHRQCALPLVAMQVLSSGEVSFCGGVDFNANAQLSIGHLNNQTLAEILASEKVRRLWAWDVNGVPEYCRTCTAHMSIDRLTQVPNAFSHPEVFGAGG
jgi:hypothetical protein